VSLEWQRVINIPAIFAYLFRHALVNKTEQRVYISHYCENNTDYDIIIIIIYIVSHL